MYFRSSLFLKKAVMYLKYLVVCGCVAKGKARDNLGILLIVEVEV